MSRMSHIGQTWSSGGGEASPLNLLEDVEWTGPQAQGTSRVPGVQIGKGRGLGQQP